MGRTLHKKYGYTSEIRMKKDSAEKRFHSWLLNPSSYILGFSFLVSTHFLGLTSQLSPTLAAESAPQNQLFEPPEFAPAEFWRNVRLVYTLEGHKATVDSLLFSQDGKVLFSGGSNNDGQLMLWWLRTGQRIEHLRAHRTAIPGLVMSSDGEMLVSCGTDAAINLWQRQGNNYKYAYTRTYLTDFDNLLALAITPDNETLISGGLDGIKVWNLKTQRPIYTLSRFDNQTYALAASPNGSVFASGGKDSAVKLWNLKSGGFIDRFLGHRGPISTLAYSPNGQFLVSGSYDRTIKVWNALTGQLFYTLAGHTGQIRSIAIHPGGELLASASRDGVRLWNLNTGQLIALLAAHNDWVESVAFSPDGRTLATGGYDRTVRVWRLPSPQQEARLQSIVK